MSFCAKQDLLDDSLCQQPYTAAGAGLAGSQLAVSPSYQTTYASVSFQSPGTWLGLTFRQQFMRALQVLCGPSSVKTIKPCRVQALSLHLVFLALPKRAARPVPMHAQCGATALPVLRRSGPAT